MTDEQLRSWLYTGIEAWRTANYPDVPAFYENAQLPDQATVGPMWLDVKLRFTGGEEATVGTRPIGRDTGNLSVGIYYREGEGTQLADQLRRSLAEYLRTNNRAESAYLGYPVRMMALPGAALGWYKTGLLVPFKNTQQ